MQGFSVKKSNFYKKKSHFSKGFQISINQSGLDACFQSVIAGIIQNLRATCH